MTSAHHQLRPSVIFLCPQESDDEDADIKRACAEDGEGWPHCHTGNPEVLSLAKCTRLAWENFQKICKFFGENQPIRNKLDCVVFVAIMQHFCIGVANIHW